MLLTISTVFRVHFHQTKHCNLASTEQQLLRPERVVEELSAV